LKKFPLLAAAATLCISLAYAADDPPAPPREQGHEKADIENDQDAAPSENDAGRLNKFAREKREKYGCAAAAPAYRVIAGMGEGQEAAQHELGECLLTMIGANGVETALFRQEGEFWLTRAAYAGNARAQRKLAMEMASPASALHDKEGSLKWALVYGKNPTADLYGYGPLPPTMVRGLKSSLNEQEIADAEQFARDFAPVLLAKFEGPKRDGKDGRNSQWPPDGFAPPGGRRRRPGLSE